MEETMIARLRQAGMPLFVVFDGARVDRIDTIFEANDLVGLPIFQSKDHAIVLAGPWLVSAAPDGTNFAEIIALARRCQSGVCWGTTQGENALVRHLRILNVARLPDQRMVYSRHYDPDVLAFLAPLLNLEQAAKLFGPARILGFVIGRGAGAVVDRPEVLPTPKAGPLWFSDWQLEEMGKRQIVLRREKIAGMLVEQFPERTKQYSFDELLKKVTYYETQASSIGLRTESGHAKWAYLNMMSNQDLHENRDLIRHLREVNQDIDVSVESEFEMIIFDYRLSENWKRLSKKTL